MGYNLHDVKKFCIFSDNVKWELIVEDIFAEVLGGIVLSVGDVVLSVGKECGFFVGCERADDLCRYAKCEDTGSLDIF